MCPINVRPGWSDELSVKGPASAKRADRRAIKTSPWVFKDVMKSCEDVRRNIRSYGIYARLPPRDRADLFLKIIDLPL